ncbi:A/G-specific adenine glycosylase [Schleiferiaceae bacterium]|nr:A/G-specific adenine glycosylase [Flavobacteriales bacterium]MDC1022368.1 A/G-specific adenine glycosylase [Schleiferiaceae bacterium]|tara:strand:+ start:552 stop:1556 length:1005 start_codon:yes stop_codon:yes gene_type:complete
MPSDLLNTFRISIEDFYRSNKRSMPWRKQNPVPYEVWLSEVILQQTRVAQGIPYFNKILQAFPTIEDLANANEDHLLSLWTGLGYYNRARNLQKGAQQVMRNHKGELPKSSVDLIKITGIGPYTAAAISSICHGEKIGVVDGNVFRVLSRFFGVSTPVNTTAGLKEFQLLANEIVHLSNSSAGYNQGIMEFGALHCTPKKPLCMMCELADICTAYNSGKVDVLPVKKKTAKRTTEEIHFAVVTSENEIAMSKRGTKGIWAGLYEFPRLEKPPVKGFEAVDKIVHKLSHKDLHCHFWEVTENEMNESLTYYSKPEIRNLGMPIIIAKFVEKIGFQ